MLNSASIETHDTKAFARAVFGPEWLAVAGLVLFDAFLIARLGFHFAFALKDAAFPALALLAVVIAMFLRSPRAQMIAEFLAVNLAAVPALCILTYLSLAAS